MIQVKGYAAQSATSVLAPFSFERRQLGPKDILIDIAYCGICHSDIHQVKNEWGGSRYPMVPGHEIVGRVSKVGNQVNHFRVGDPAGVGCFVDSCRSCPSCKENEEQYCEGHLVTTYNNVEKDGKTPTFGGYSSKIVVDEDYALRIASELPLERIAPLLCAGVTTYSPLKQWNVERGTRVGILGLGGLGHMGVKLAVAMGAEVSVLSHSPHKEADARKLGAHHFISTQQSNLGEVFANHFDLILDTVSAPHDLNMYLSTVKKDGTMVLLGVPPESTKIAAFPLILKRRRLAGSLIGGIKETQEMLDFCAENSIGADVEVISALEINTAYERTLKGDVKYRFAIDCKTF
ncbi:MAG: NAD(P)-dependent alcohol dehydrogenase [Deltaproteobacteria bacterium]|nr:NAD(P)-dependent alcohol dehydrogenase [Deltaproteobacteria bacterium]